MASNKAVAKETPASKEIAVSKVAGFMAQDVGRGTEDMGAQDMVIPFLSILQALSPQLDKKKGEFIKGASVGMIMNTATKDVYDGDEGILVVPCYYQRRITEWIPRKAGGGFVRDWTGDPDILERVPQNAERKRITPEGNDIVESATFYTLHLTKDGVQRCVISMSSTQWQPARRWNTMIAQQRVQVGEMKRPAPIFYRAYHLTTTGFSNDSGSWYGWVPNPGSTLEEMKNGLEVYGEAKAYYAAARGGEVSAQPPIQASEDGETPF